MFQKLKCCVHSKSHKSISPLAQNPEPPKQNEIQGEQKESPVNKSEPKEKHHRKETHVKTNMNYPKTIVSRVTNATRKKE